MMLTLSAKHKLGFVNGMVGALEPTFHDFKSWEHCNDLVISLYNLDDNIARSILFLMTSRTIWKDLEDRFGNACMQQISSPENKLAEMHQGQ